MREMSGREFYDTFNGRRRAFHVEMRDRYNVEQEVEPFSKWLNGEADDFEWRREWLAFIAGITTSGVAVQRLRIISEPPTDFIRWEMSCDPQNLDAGEEIRYLPRQETTDLGLPPEDFWLFDDDTLVLSLFKPDGRSGGFASVSDPSVIAHHCGFRDIVWSRAIRHAVYRPKHKSE